MTHFLAAANWMQDTSIRSLRALTTADAIYKSFPDATVPLRICSRALDEASWVPDAIESGVAGFMLMFGLVRVWQSQFRPSSLGRVMAMSTGNSLYIAECLLKDPFLVMITMGSDELSATLADLGFRCC
jgi:hypothetical protein